MEACYLLTDGELHHPVEQVAEGFEDRKVFLIALTTPPKTPIFPHIHEILAVSR